MHGGNLFKTVLIICLEHSCTGNFKKILIDQVMEWLSAVFKHLFFFFFQFVDIIFQKRDGISDQVLKKQKNIERLWILFLLEC